MKIMDKIANARIKFIEKNVYVPEYLYLIHVDKEQLIVELQESSATQLFYVDEFLGMKIAYLDFNKSTLFSVKSMSFIKDNKIYNQEEITYLYLHED